MRVAEAVWKNRCADTYPGARSSGKAVLENGCGKTFWRGVGSGRLRRDLNDDGRPAAGARWTKYGASPLTGFFSEWGSLGEKLPPRREGGGAGLRLWESSRGAGLWGLDQGPGVEGEAKSYLLNGLKTARRFPQKESQKQLNEF